MGGIGVSRSEVWGAKNSVVYHLVLFCISRAGLREYLQDAKNMMDRGYNWFGVEASPDDEFLEFLSLVKAYRNERGFYMSFSESSDSQPYKLDLWDESELIPLFDELIGKLERARPHLLEAARHE